MMPSARAPRAALIPSLLLAAFATLVLVLLAIATPAGALRACEAYERCMSINECPTLRRRLAAHNKRPNKQDVDVLRKAQCGEGAQVCCPLVPVSDCGPMNTPEKIIGGTRAVVKEFPWAARLGYKVQGTVLYLCGGILISDRYVLTAAHCIRGNRKPITVRLGEYDTEEDEDCSTISGQRVCAPPVVDVPVDNIQVHSEYEHNTSKPTGLWNDIALIRLERSVPTTESVQPVCLPLRLANSKEDVSIESKVDFTLTVVGWGKISNTDTAATDRYLSKLQLRVAPLNECAPKYANTPNRINGERQMCAIGKNNSDVCKGDSGGPLTAVTLLGGKVHSVLRGIVSFGPSKCATSGTPAVFTRVTYYIPWILNAIKP